jgi:stage V sporulation protein G
MGSLEAALMQWQTTLGLPCSVNPSVVQGSEAPVLTRKLARRISSATPGANMQITDVQIYLWVQGTLRGYADVTFDDCLSIREIRLLRTATGYRVCMPEVKQQDGTFRSIAYPTDDKMLKAIEDAVIAEYKKVTGASIRSRRRVWLPT